MDIYDIQTDVHSYYLWPSFFTNNPVKKVWMLPFSYSISLLCQESCINSFPSYTVSLSVLEASSHAFSPPMTTAKKDKTSFAATYFKEID